MCDSTTPPAATAGDRPPCPPWCHPESCEVTEGDVTHYSQTVLVATADGQIGLTLFRIDDRREPEYWNRTPLLQLYVENTQLAGDAAGVEPLCALTELALDAVPGLIDALAVHLLRGRGLTR